MREHIQHATLHRRIRGHALQILRQSHRVTARIHHTVNTRTLNPRAQALTNTAARRVHHQHLRHRARRHRELRRVLRRKVHALQPILSHRALRRSHRLRANLNARHRAAVHHRRGMQSKTTHTAVQVPQRARSHLTHPLAALRIHRLSNLRVRLEEALRAQMQGQVIHLHRQGLTLREDNLLIALNARYRFTQQVHRQHRQVRQLLLQPPQLAANRHQQLLRTQHETHHQLARRRSSHQNILQLTATIRNVIGGQVCALNQLTQHRNSRLNRLHIEWAFAKISGCARTIIHNAQGRVLRRTAHHKLRLVAEARLRTGHRVQPLQLRVVGEQGAGVLLLRLHLRGVGGLNAGAGGAEVITKIGAFHKEPFYRLHRQARRRPITDTGCSAAHGHRKSGGGHPSWVAAPAPYGCVDLCRLKYQR